MKDNSIIDSGLENLPIKAERDVHYDSGLQ